MKFFIGDVINFQHGFDRYQGKVIGLTEKGELPLVNNKGLGCIVPSDYSYETIVFISKSPEHIKWENPNASKISKEIIKKKNIIRRIIDKIF